MSNCFIPHVFRSNFWLDVSFILRELQCKEAARKMFKKPCVCFFTEAGLLRRSPKHKMLHLAACNCGI